MTGKEQRGRKRSSQSVHDAERHDEVPSARPAGEDHRSEIVERAYARYLARGRGDGRDMEDWLEAEADILRRTQ